MEIKVKIDNHKGGQLINLFKKFGIEFTVERDGSSEFVDLGLPSGLKWATCNVGAKTPTEYGKYFRWGEITDAREMGSAETYDYNKPFEDAATYHMGGAWRMPTTEEFQELYANTTSKWIKNYQGYGVSGRLFTSKVNGNELFFPAAGYCGNGSALNVGTGGYVWSSSLYASYPYYAYYLNFLSSNVYPQGTQHLGRYFGRSVRGVRV